MVRWDGTRVRPRVHAACVVLGCVVLVVLACGCADTHVEEDADVRDASSVDAHLPLADAGVDASADAGVDAFRPDAYSPFEHPPERPMVADESGPPLSFALRAPGLSHPEDWASVAFDLDHEITDGTSLVCMPPGDAPSVADGARGEDNAFALRLMPVLALVSPELEDEARAGTETAPIVLHIDGWNGRAEDPRVTVWLAHALPGESAPRWDGTDRWSLEDSDFVEGAPDRPINQDDNAFVAGGRLVAELPARQSIRLRAPDGGTLEFRLTQTRFVATLEEGALSGVTMTGRFASIDLDFALDLLGICPEAPDHAVIQAEIARSQDVRSTPGSGGPGATCDALSVGIDFSATRAEIGAIDPAMLPVGRCD